MARHFVGEADQVAGVSERKPRLAMLHPVHLLDSWNAGLTSEQSRWRIGLNEQQNGDFLNFVEKVRDMSSKPTFHGAWRLSSETSCRMMFSAP
jgi:hypothetical protein